MTDTLLETVPILSKKSGAGHPAFHPKGASYRARQTEIPVDTGMTGRKKQDRF